MAASPDKVLAVLTKLTDSISKLPLKLGTSATGMAAGAASAVASPLNSIDKIVSPITSAFTGIADKIMSMARPLVSLVEKMNPTVVQMFEFAINDLMAVFGDILQPILVAITQVTRKLADVFKTMKPVIDPIIASVVKMIGIFAKLIEPIARIMVPIFNVLAAILDGIVIPVLERFVQVLEWLAKGVLYIVNQIIKAYNEVADTTLGKRLGLGKIKELQYDELEKKSSVGESIRQTSRMSGVDLGRQTREGAFGQVAWQGKMLENANKMLDLFNRLPVKFDQTLEWLKQINEQMSRQAGQQNAG